MKTLTQIIANHYDLPNRSFDYLDLLSSIIERLEADDFAGDNTGALMEALDDELIYYDDQWTVLKEWCTPTEANWNFAIESTVDDLYTIFYNVKNELDEIETENDDNEQDD